MGKRMNEIIAAMPSRDKAHQLTEVLTFLKEQSRVKFVERVDVAIRLGVDVRKNQVVRGAVTLPHGTGKNVRVAVFAQGDAADAARAAGADIVGYDDLAEQISKGEMNFDVAIATPAAMAVVGKLGQVLGPRGLMPNPKMGTVTADVAEAVKKSKAGQARFRTDKSAIIHCAIGLVSFDVQALADNLNVLLQELKRLKPSDAKGIYIQKISLSTTMGPGVEVDKATVEAV